MTIPRHRETGSILPALWAKGKATPSSFLRWLLTGNLLAISILLILVGLILSHDQAAYQERAAQSTRNLAQVLDQDITALIAKTDLSLQTIAHEVARENAQGGLDQKTLDELLARQLVLLPELFVLRIADAEGYVRYGLTAPMPVRRDVLDRNFFLEARLNPGAGLIIDGPLKSRIGKWVVFLSRRLNRPDGSFQGIAYAGIDITHFEKLFSTMDLEPGSAVALRTTDLRLVTHHPAPPEGTMAIGSTQVPPEFARSLDSHPGSGTFVTTSPADGAERIASYTRIGDHPFYIIVAQATESYLAPWRAEVARVSALTALVVLVMALSSWIAYGLWRRQWLAAESLRESEERYRLMVESARDYAVFMLDPEGRVASWNEGAARLTGYLAEETVGQPLSILCPTPLAANSDGAAAPPLAEGQESAASEEWRLRKDGTLFMASTSITALHDDSGHLRGYTVILRDVSEQRLAELAAKKANTLLLEAVESIAVGFSIYGPDDRLLICNEAYRNIYRTSRDLIVPGVRFEDLIRHGAERGQSPGARGKIDAWVRQRVRQHRSANGTPVEQELDDGRHLLIVEYRTPSGHIVGNQLDITELHRHQHHLEQLVEARTAELKASMAQFRILIEQAPTAMAMLDRNLNYLAVSRRWVKDYGRGRSDLVGQNHYELHPDTPERWRKTHLAALAGASVRNDKDHWTHADGTTQWLRWAAYPWTDEKGDIGGIIISAEDITDRRRAEERIRESEARFRSAFEQAAVGLAHLSLDGRWLRVNQKLCDIVGYSREELLELNFRDLTAPPDADAPLEEAGQLLIETRAIPSYCLERRYRRKDGSLVWVNVTMSLVRAATGEADHFMAVVEDIQRRKEAEIALAEEREIFRSLSRISSDYFWEQDDQFRFTNVSGSIASRSGIEVKNLIGKTRWDFPYLGLSEKDWAAHRAILEAHQPFRNLELGLINQDGEKRWFSVSGDPVFSAEGQFKGYRGVTQDITERLAHQKFLESHQKILEQQVAERTAELVAANKELQGFTYAASHDLKAPLGRINAFSTLLENNYRDRLDGDGLLFLDFIRRNAMRMSALIEDLLAHAQIEQKILDLQPIPLPEAIQAALKEREGEIRQVGAEVRQDLPDITVRANPHGLSQVLGNLLENALKYSCHAQPPVIEIGARPEGGRCRLWVRDNGIGFDMVYHDRIFEIFRRLHTYEEFPGSGVGLALVRKAMERMGGRVWAESAPGQGATFYLELETVEPSQAPPRDGTGTVGENVTQAGRPGQRPRSQAN